MGVWANGPDPTKADLMGIAEAMRPAVRQWMTGHVRIYDPNRDSTGEPILVLDSGPQGALVQPLRAPSAIDIGGQPSNLLGIRFQITRAPVEVDLTKLGSGLVVRVIDGGNSPLLEIPTYSLGEVMDSTLGWDYIFEATVATGGY